MPVGQLQYLQSKVDGKLHPCAVCVTDTSNEPKPLIVEVSPGALGNLPGAVELTEQLAGIAARHNQPCIVLRPTGRGSGSVYQNYGEIDVLEAIEHVASNYAIDRDRITITGSSICTYNLGRDFSRVNLVHHRSQLKLIASIKYIEDYHHTPTLT